MDDFEKAVNELNNAVERLLNADVEQTACVAGIPVNDFKELLNKDICEALALFINGLSDNIENSKEKLIYA